MFVCLQCVTLPISGQGQYSRLKCWPSEWWVGMKNNKLLLIIQGNQISNGTANIVQSGVSIINQYAGDNPSYLFVEIEISPNTTPSTFAIRVTTPNQPARIVNFHLIGGKQSFQPMPLSGADVIYQILPDRFVNANPSNDSFIGLFEQADRMNPAGIHGGDFEGVLNSISYLRQLGITAIELSPVYESNQLVLSYERFAPTDHYRTDPRLGELQELTNLVAHYRNRNIKFILTKVLHKVGNQHSLMQNPPSQNWILKRDDSFGTSENPYVFADPYSSKEDYLKYSHKWDSFDTPSLNYQNPELRKYMIQNVLWWIQKTQPDGFKIEQTQLVHPLLLEELTQAVKLEYPNLNIIASPQTSSPILNNYWKIGDNNKFEFTHVTDQPLYNIWKDVFAEYQKTNDVLKQIYRFMGSDRVYDNPTSQLILLGDNHNSTRLFTLAEKDINIFKMYVGFLLTARGIPTFLYGSEVLLEGMAQHGLGFIRSDFPGGWANDKESAFNISTLNNHQRDAIRFMTTLLNWRQNNPELMKGKTIHFEPVEDIYAYFRISDEKKLLVIINNHPSSPRRVESSRFSQTTGKVLQVTNILNGETSSGLGTLLLGPKSITILEIK